MLTFFDYSLLVFGLIALITLFVVVFANKNVLFTDYGNEPEQAIIKQHQAEIKRLEQIIEEKNKTITNLLNEKTT